MCGAGYRLRYRYHHLFSIIALRAREIDKLSLSLSHCHTQKARGTCVFASCFTGPSEFTAFFVFLFLYSSLFLSFE